MSVSAVSSFVVSAKVTISPDFSPAFIAGEFSVTSVSLTPPSFTSSITAPK